MLIKARGTVLHIEAGYTTDNLLLLSNTGGLAMREETIYDLPETRLHKHLVLAWNTVETQQHGPMEGRVPSRPAS